MLNATTVVDLRPHLTRARRRVRPARVATSSTRQRAGDARRAPRPAHRRSRHHLVEQLALQRQRLIGGFGDAAGEVASSSVVKRTALPIVWRWRNSVRVLARHQLVGVLRRHFDEIAEHAIVLDA